MKNWLFYSLLILSVTFIVIPMCDGYSFLSALQNIGFSVLAAYIFYFVTIYIPRKQKQKQAERILYSNMFNIVSYMEKIIAILNEGFITIKEDNHIVCKNDSVASVDNIVYFKIRDFLFAENITFFLKYYAQKIKNNINCVISHRCFSNLDEKTIDNILRLQKSGILRIILGYFVLPKQGETSICYGNIYKDFEEFSDIFLFLKKEEGLPTVQDMTDKELDHYNNILPQIKTALKNGKVPLNGILILNKVCYIPK